MDGTAVLVTYTLFGDANLDRTVDTIDFNLLAARFGDNSQRWNDGDFNYDGNVDTIDFNALTSNFGSTLPAQTGSGTLRRTIKSTTAAGLRR